jgi:fructose-1,6-bisphosphatase/inositol monophosphatase family enzyme
VTDEPTWIVDPIDGTTNFVHRFPFSCVSIGLAIGKKVVVGVVYNPMMGEMFTAIRGQGAKLNGEPISISQTTDLKQALVATGFPYQRDDATLDHVLANVKIILQHCRAVRRAGSAALDMCYVARGVFDIYYEAGVHAWDIAAGALIVEEAGGYVKDMYDTPFSLGLRRVACGNRQLIEAATALLKRPTTQ